MRPSLTCFCFCFLAFSAITANAANSNTPTLDEPFQTSFKALPHDPCVSVFTREGRVGCGTFSRDVMSGTIMHWPTLASSDYYSSLASSLTDFVAIVDEFQFTSDTVDQIIASTSSDTLNGIIVLNATTSSSSSSASYLNPAPTSPRGQNTPSSQLTPDNDYEWNANGDGLIVKDLYGVPTVYVSDESMAAYLLNEAKQQSESFITANTDATAGSIFDQESTSVPPIIAEFNMYMGPDEMDTKTCLSWIDTDDIWRPKCLPLGGNSVWAAAGSPPKSSGGDLRRRTEDVNDAAADGELPIVLVATNLDSTSMFHDRSPGANAAASNILTALMAAKLLGQISDSNLDALNKKIVFAFFQGESYGYLGSRSFLKDVAYPGFQCDDGMTVPTVAKTKDEANPQMSCLNPMRHDLAFASLGGIDSMIAIDQVGIPSDDQTFYVHSYDYYGDNALSTILQGLSSDDWTVSAASSGSTPPTPLSSLIKLSGGKTSGVVLAGYDAAFADNAYYQSHLDSAGITPISMEAIAQAATLTARAALAYAYNGNNGDDDGNNNGDDGIDYASNQIADLDSDDETLVQLADCLFSDGKCNLLKDYSKMDRVNSREETSRDAGSGAELGTPPNFYVSVFDHRNGQAFAIINDNVYGAYSSDDSQYGVNENDVVLIRPSVLEAGIRGLLNDFLGRGSVDDTDSNDFELTSCQSSADCTDVSYCSSSGDAAVCTGGKSCVCSRSHFHVALDEAIVPLANNFTGFFDVSDDDEGVSPMYSEPYWSNDIGVSVYRDGMESGSLISGLGVVITAASVVATIFLKKRLHKEKLY